MGRYINRHGTKAPTTVRMSLQLPKERDPFFQTGDRSRLRLTETRRGLFHAVKTGNLAEVVRMLDEDPHASLEEQNLDGEVLLHVAASEGCWAIVNVLLERDANPNAQGVPKSGSLTPLMCAVINGHDKIADLILSKLSDKNLDLNVGNVDGMTALHL